MSKVVWGKSRFGIFILGVILGSVICIPIWFGLDTLMEFGRSLGAADAKKEVLPVEEEESEPPRLEWNCYFTGTYDGLCDIHNPTQRIGSGCARLFLMTHDGLQIDHTGQLCTETPILPWEFGELSWELDFYSTREKQKRSFCGQFEGISFPPCVFQVGYQEDTWGEKVVR